MSEQKRPYIEIEHFSFYYPERTEKVLDDLTLTVEQGEFLVLCGPSGCGKSTLLRQLKTVLAPHGRRLGSIRFEGCPLEELDQREQSAGIGFVQQDVYLFSGSVFENIQYGKPGASKEEVIAASKMAGAHEFIEGLSNGYDTYVGERGVKLSGGQKQRISIARAFLKNPPILILDEATSALDNESERIVQASLEKLAKGRTTFTIAHRLTTIKNATKILVLTDKGIEEAGTHQELMKKKGIYFDLYKSYQEMTADTE